MRNFMGFSVLQNPRCRIRLINGNTILQPISYASIWIDNVLRIGSSPGRNSLKPVASVTNSYSSEALTLGLRVKSTKGISRRLIEQLKTTETCTRKSHIQSSKPGTVRPHELLDGVIMASKRLHLNKSEANIFESIKYCDVQQEIECRDIQQLVTIFVFDIETTGLSRKTERIVEFGLRDLSGGDNSTFHTLVNPEKCVSNQHVHGISTDMVNRSNVPRFKDVIPIIHRYAQRRQIPDKPILWVAHNARCFDVPFLIEEFSRCSEEIPSDWLFLDTLPLARELAKSEGAKNLSGKSMQALREYYGIPLVGAAHRAMSDVHSLAKILQEMTIDLKMPISSLLERTFRASDIINAKKKKKSAS